MDEITIKDEVRYSIAEHEVLLSFINDNDAEVFYDWWTECCEKQFREWVKDE